MSDTTQKTLEIVLKGRDDGTFSMLDGATRKMSTLAQQLKQGGDIGELTGVKKFGKNVGEFLGLNDGSSEIKGNANQMRSGAAGELRDTYAKINAELATGQATELRTAKLLDQKNQAAEKYKKTIQEINAAEASSLKEGRAGTGIARGIAVAGGTLAAINVAGGIAEAWDKANQKLEEGKIGAAEWTGELAKGLPIIGGTVQKAETLLMVITGTAKAMREANKEAAELDKKINGQNADRKRVDDLVKGTAGLNDTDKQRINREANAKLKEIADARAAGEASGVVNKGNDRDIALRKAEAEIIKKREADLAKVEAAEREARARQVEAVEERLFQGKKTIEDQRTAQRIADLKEQGKEQEAAVLEIQAKTAEKLAGLDRQRAKLTGEKGLSDRQRIDINNSIDAQKQAAMQAGQAEIAASNREAARNAEEKLKRAEEKLASEQERQQKERIEQGRESLSNQRSPRSSITDARGQGGFIAQSREFITPQVEAKKSTDANTKATEELTKTIAALKDVIAALGGGTNNAGFVG